jgi:hypothetical protein
MATDRPGQSSSESSLATAKSAADRAAVVYSINPTQANLQTLANANANYKKAQVSVSSQDVNRTSVGSGGEGDVPPDSPDTIQTKTAEEEAAALIPAAPDATSFIYSDVNMHYILDKRHVPFRTSDSVKHVFFLESYKSIEVWQKSLADATGGTAGQPPAGTRFAGITIKVMRTSGGDPSKEEISYFVNPPSEFDVEDEDNIVDSILWAFSSYKGGVAAFTSSEEATVDEVLPILSAGNEGGFLFPVFVADPTKDVLTPMTNLKYFNICYNEGTNLIDMSFWGNYRETDDGAVNSHPFTRGRDLRNVGRALMYTTGWYDTAKIVFNEQTYYRNIFVFAPPQKIFVPGIGGEFDVDRIEPVVDSIPMGMKFVEFSA